MKEINSLELTDYDSVKFKNLKIKVSKALSIDILKVSLVIREYIRFMQLSANHEKMIPSKMVDVVWHEHILFTKDYIKFCELITRNTKKGERYIHHNPSEYQASNVDYMNTLNWYYTEFNNEPPANVWLYSNKKEWVKYKIGTKPNFEKFRPTSMDSNYDHDDSSMDPLAAAMVIDSLIHSNDSIPQVESVKLKQEEEQFDDIETNNTDKAIEHFSSSNYSESNYNDSNSSSSSCSSSSCSSD
jgi:hypothetical protein